MATDAPAAAGLSWNPVSDVAQLFRYHFMVNALAAGTIIAVLAGVLGWFMVLRRQTFAGHTLSVIAFPGAAAAVLAGLPALVGYLGFCGVGGVVLAAFGARDARPGGGVEAAAIGSLQALCLGLGFLFVSLYAGVLNGVDSLLFGTFLGIDDRQLVVLLAIGGLTLIVLAAVGRPLLFASVDGELARASGVPVAALSVAFLLLLGLAVAATSQLTGALLVFSLLVGPPATAQVLTPRPGLSLALAVTLGLLVTWLGLAIAYFSVYPVGFWITSLSFGIYLAARLARRRSRQSGFPPREHGRVHA
jgi:zinc/manganese transport system permease protein